MHLTPIVALGLMLAAPATIHKRATTARIASVESRVDAKKLTMGDPKPALRAELEQALAGVDWKREGVGAPFEVLAVLADADSAITRDGVRANCVVQVVIREPSGAILGTVSGSAKGQDKGNARASLEREVLEAATESASAAIPEAVRRSRKAR
jgi:hypothetical protein